MINKARATALAALATTLFAGQDPAVLPPLHVRESPSSLLSLQAQPQSLRDRQEELSRFLNTLPGVSFASRGPSGGEPVLRGLGWERVRTDFNGLSLHGACPARMDPPAALLSAASLQRVDVDLGSGSVTDGPGGLGGRIRVSTRTDWNPEDPRPPLLRTGVAVESNLDRIALNALGRKETELASVTVSGSWSTQDNYTSGDGTRVPANRELREIGADGTLKLQDPLFLDFALRRIEERDVDFPALPMDSRYIDINLLTLNLRWLPEGERLTALELRGGMQQVDHLMDNRDRPNRRMMEAFNPTTSDTYSTRLLSRWAAGEGELRLGADASRLEREATRRRTMVATGMTFRDPIWADLKEEQAGLFAEWEGPVQEGLTLLTGVRLDYVDSRMGQPNLRTMPGPGTGPVTLADAFTRFGESTSGRTSNEDTLVSGNLALRQQLSEEWSATVGFNRVAAAPNLSQRYDGFSARPGGFGLGNPDLDPEVKHQIELRLDGEHAEHRFGLAVHAARVDDYIKPTLIGRRDITGDGMMNPIFSHRNVDAVLYGFEIGADIQLVERLRFPVQLGLTRGEERGGGALPEIPPLEGSAALRREGPAFVQFGVDFAARQTRIDPDFGERETAGYALTHLRIGADVRPGLRIEAGIENLFDKEYARHLTRNAVMPVGDLRPGDRIPEPGRSFTLALRAEW